jgi:AcrR family transcriptional regulator
VDLAREKTSSTYHHGDLRRALLDAALDMVRTDGAAQLSLREVARRAGVSHAAPYRHFADKEALLAAVAEEGFRGLHDAMAKAAAASPGPVEALQATGRAYVAFALDRPAHFKVMFASDRARPYPELDAAAACAFGVLVSTLQRGVDAGALVQRPAAELAIPAWSIVHGVAHLLLDGHLAGAGTSDELARLVTTHLVAGLRREAP